MAEQHHSVEGLQRNLYGKAHLHMHRLRRYNVQLVSDYWMVVYILNVVQHGMLVPSAAGYRYASSTASGGERCLCPTLLLYMRRNRIQRFLSPSCPLDRCDEEFCWICSGRLLHVILQKVGCKWSAGRTSDLHGRFVMFFYRTRALPISISEQASCLLVPAWKHTISCPASVSCGYC